MCIFYTFTQLISKLLLKGGKKDLSLFLCMGQTLERTTFISDRFISVTSLYCATVPQNSICVLSLVTISCSAFLNHSSGYVKGSMQSAHCEQARAD